MVPIRYFLPFKFHIIIGKQTNKSFSPYWKTNKQTNRSTTKAYRINLDNFGTEPFALFIVIIFG